jgi:hypothetical protein
MKSKYHRTIGDQLPQVFDRRREPQNCPDGLIVLPGDIDDPLNDALSADFSEPDLSELDADSLVGKARDAEGMVRERLQVHEELSGAFDPSDFPGAPAWPRDQLAQRPTLN